MADELPEYLYHYTDVGGLHGILSTGVLWATHIGYLNDARELFYGANETAKHLDAVWNSISDERNKYQNYEALKLLFDALRNNLPELIEPLLHRIAGLYVTCFCRDGDLLSQWRGYGGDGGYAIKFDVKQLRDSIRRLPEKSANAVQLSDQPGIIEVRYDTERLPSEVNGVLVAMAEQLQHEQVILNTGFGSGQRVAVDYALANIVGLSARLKNPAFREENEYRIGAFVPTMATNDAVEACHYYPGKVGLIPRVHLSFARSSIKGVIVGPGDFASTRKASVEHFLATHLEYETVNVEPSLIPFRTMK